MQKLDRLGWAEGICVDCYGVKVGIRASQSGTLYQVLPHLPPRWEPIEPPRRLDALYSWVVGGERRPGLRTFNLLYGGAGRIVRSLNVEEVLAILGSSLRQSISLLSRRFVFIHAGAVGWQGRAILIPARTFHGKSTLVEALVRAGAVYLSDEFAVLDAAGRVHSFPKPISMRIDTAQHDLPMELLNGRIATSPMKVGAIVATRYRSGPSRFRAASRGQGILDLIANAVAARFAPRRVLSATRKASAGAMVLRGPRGEADEAARLLLATIDSAQSSSRRLISKQRFDGGSSHGITPEVA
jgi:hypothetical protein